MANKWKNKYGLYNEAYGSRDFQFTEEGAKAAKEICRKLKITVKKIEEDIFTNYYAPYYTEFIITATGTETITFIDALKKANIKGKYYDGLIEFHNL